MLQSSDGDIENDKLVTQKQLDKKDSEFLKLSMAQKKELDRRINELENGIGRTYTWDETVVMTDQALADRKDNS